MRAGLSSWLGLGLLGLGAFSACLPEVTVDDDVIGSAGTGVQTGKGSLNGGSGGASGSTTAPPSGGSAGTPAVSGAGGSASGGAPSTAEIGGSSGGGVGGSETAGSSGTGGTSGAAGIAGAAGAPAIAANAGEDVCPSNVTPEQACDDYCALYTEACGNFPTYDYAGATDCSTVCQSSGWPIGTIAQPNSILCRCNHAYKAKVFQQDPHCFHAARVPQKTGGCEIPAVSESP